MATAYETRRMGKKKPDFENNAEKTSEALTALRDAIRLFLSKPGYSGTIGVKVNVKDNRILGVDTQHQGGYK